VPNDGVEVAVDLEALIEHIMLGPELSKTDLEIIVEKSRSLGLGDRLLKSSLLGQPRFI